MDFSHLQDSVLTSSIIIICLPVVIMNGFPLVLLGMVLFVVAYFLIKIQSKMKEITDAIDMGFKTIEDGLPRICSVITGR
jgi:hypothetical protein